MVDIADDCRWNSTGRILREEGLAEHDLVPSQGVAPVAG
jgi:hypothetical protein